MIENYEVGTPADMIYRVLTTNTNAPFSELSMLLMLWLHYVEWLLIGAVLKWGYCGTF